jgi:hypothetical protein
VLSNTHNRGKRHGSLVERLQEVCADHDDQDAAIDHSPQALVGRLVNDNGLAAGILGDFLVDTSGVDDILGHALAAREDALDVSRVLDLLGHGRGSWVVGHGECLQRSELQLWRRREPENRGRRGGTFYRRRPMLVG